MKIIAGSALPRYLTRTADHDHQRTNRDALIEIEDILMRIRIHPEETKRPMVAGSLVPWIR